MQMQKFQSNAKTKNRHKIQYYFIIFYNFILLKMENRQRFRNQVDRPESQTVLILVHVTAVLEVNTRLHSYKKVLSTKKAFTLE